jgi:hypothetical protein
MRQSYLLPWVRVAQYSQATSYENFVLLCSAFSIRIAISHWVRSYFAVVLAILSPTIDVTQLVSSILIVSR